MYNNIDHFRFFEEKIKNEEEELDPYPLNPEDYNMPMIYLTDEEIKEFNQICEKENIDLKVCPLSQFTDRYPELEDDIIAKEIKIMSQTFKNKVKEDKEQKDLMEENQCNANLDYKMKYVNDYIGKKQKKTNIDPEGNRPNEKCKENQDNSDDGSDSSINDEIYKNESGQYKQNKKKNSNKKANNAKNKKKKIIEDEEDEKEEKKSNIEKEKDIMRNNFFKYFERIKTSSQHQQNEEKRIKEFIDKIMIKSQYLTQDALNDISKNKHIKIIGHQLSIHDLKQKSIFQLEDILVNIEINVEFNKLEPKRGNNIRDLLNKEETERKNLEKALEKKRLKEEMMKNRAIKGSEKNNGENKHNDEDQSESSYDDKSLD